MMRTRRALWPLGLVFMGCALLLGPAAWAQEPAEGAPEDAAEAADGAAGPDAGESASEADVVQQLVYVGVYVNQIPAVRLKENEFVIDFWVWFRWTSDQLDPMASFELANGRIDSKNEPYRSKLPDGINYAATRVSATITKFWDRAPAGHALGGVPRRSRQR